MNSHATLIYYNKLKLIIIVSVLRDSVTRRSLIFLFQKKYDLD